MIDRKELAGQLKEAARLLEVLGGDGFRVRAYQNAARALEVFEGDLAELVRDGRLTEIRGIGRGLAAELSECAEVGRLLILDELYDQVPESVREMFRVSGLGARKIAQLWGSGIVGLEALVAAADDGRLAALRGFGARSAGNVAVAARFALEARKRMRLDEAEEVVAVLTEALARGLPQASVTVAGELRRGLETVGELDLLVTGATDAELTACFEGMLEQAERREGSLEGTFLGRRVRLGATETQVFGAVLALRTGAEAYLETLRATARERGLELRSGGLWRGAELVPTPEEADLFGAVELPCPVPELREEAGAVPVPGLLALAEVRGLVHNHSTWSDATHGIREMAAAARARGYAYLAMADHSRSSAYANGLSVERVLAQAEEIAAVRSELAREGSDFELLHGMEVDILSDGALDYPDELLAQLDFTVVSVHQNFTLSREEQTRRIVTAVRHPYATILGHATGRLLLRRPGYEVDLEAVIAACAESGTVIEINASPYRLDMDWRWLGRARELGCRFSIDPDAHHVDGFDDVRYGVLMARKAGLTAADVVNTAPTGRTFLRQLKPRPG